MEPKRIFGKQLGKCRFSYTTAVSSLPGTYVPFSHTRFLFVSGFVCLFFFFCDNTRYEVPLLAYDPIRVQLFALIVIMTPWNILNGSSSSQLNRTPESLSPAVTCIPRTRIGELISMEEAPS